MDFEHKLPKGDGLEHSHRCPCGEMFLCRGVFKCDGSLTLLEPCPRAFCPNCTRAEAQGWAKHLDRMPEFYDTILVKR